MKNTQDMPLFPEMISVDSIKAHDERLHNMVVEKSLNPESFNPQELLNAISENEVLDAVDAQALHEMLKVVTYGKSLPTYHINHDDFADDCALFWGNLSIKGSNFKSIGSQEDIDPRILWVSLVAGGDVDVTGGILHLNGVYAKSIRAFSPFSAQNITADNLFGSKIVANRITLNGDVTLEKLHVKERIRARNIRVLKTLCASDINCNEATVGEFLQGYHKDRPVNITASSLNVGDLCAAGRIIVFGPIACPDITARDTIQARSIEATNLIAKDVDAQQVTVRNTYDVGTMRCPELILSDDIKYGSQFYGKTEQNLHNENGEAAPDTMQP